MITTTIQRIIFIYFLCVSAIAKEENLNDYSAPEQIERSNRLVEEFIAQHEQKEKLRKDPFADEIWSFMTKNNLLFVPNSKLVPEVIKKARNDWWKNGGDAEAEKAFDSLPPDDINAEFERKMNYGTYFGRRIPPDEMEKFKTRLLDATALTPQRKGPKSEDQQSNRGVGDSDSEDEEKNNTEPEDFDLNYKAPTQGFNVGPDKYVKTVVHLLFLFLTLAVLIFVMLNRNIFRQVFPNEKETCYFPTMFFVHWIALLLCGFFQMLKMFDINWTQNVQLVPGVTFFCIDARFLTFSIIGWNLHSVFEHGLPYDLIWALSLVASFALAIFHFYVADGTEKHSTFFLALTPAVCAIIFQIYCCVRHFRMPEEDDVSESIREKKYLLPLSIFTSILFEIAALVVFSTNTDGVAFCLYATLLNDVAFFFLMKYSPAQDSTKSLQIKQRANVVPIKDKSKILRAKCHQYEKNIEIIERTLYGRDFLVRVAKMTKPLSVIPENSVLVQPVCECNSLGQEDGNWFQSISGSLTKPLTKAGKYRPKSLTILAEPLICDERNSPTLLCDSPNSPCGTLPPYKQPLRTNLMSLPPSPRTVKLQKSEVDTNLTPMQRPLDENVIELIVVKESLSQNPISLNVKCELGNIPVGFTHESGSSSISSVSHPSFKAIELKKD